MEKITDGMDMGYLREAYILASYVEAIAKDVEGAPTLDKVKLSENIAKLDIERIFDKLDDFNAGPELKVEVTCTECGSLNEREINWTYDNFFGSSSL